MRKGSDHLSNYKLLKKDGFSYSTTGINQFETLWSALQT